MVKVSVLALVYNRAQYLPQSIESVVSQQTDFAFELVLVDDYSTDGAWEIVCEYQRKYPQIIRAFRQPHNIGITRNAMAAYALCRGQYVALLDTDDYFTDCAKLQKQADFLDQHSEWSGVFHSCTALFADERPSIQLQPFALKPSYSDEDLIRHHNFITTCSAMMRNGLITRYPPGFEDLVAPDYIFHILHAQISEIGYINENMATYRIHPEGQWSRHSKGKKLELMIDHYRYIEHTWPSRYSALISITQRYAALSIWHAVEQNDAQARKFGLISLRLQVKDRNGLSGYLLRVLLIVIAPVLYRQSRRVKWIYRKW